eukprot:gnl/Spiro4/11956_TR6311_c0_g1_i1.p2 gnl/Spiro4/11956_TR6311_c0_g1~~gnl/Spiro4/11956_TR6311_c0_g1_i1.p2  ORF type:complete len:132 (-),score=35.32 gnl/Spiro4/11956_TR6311_c0_g1_i1:100-468(-)
MEADAIFTTPITLTCVCRSWNAPEPQAQVSAKLFLTPTHVRVVDAADVAIVPEFTYPRGRTAISCVSERDEALCRDFTIPMDESGYTYVKFDVAAESAEVLMEILSGDEPNSCGESGGSDDD